MSLSCFSCNKHKSPVKPVSRHRPSKQKEHSRNLTRFDKDGNALDYFQAPGISTSFHLSLYCDSFVFQVVLKRYLFAAVHLPTGPCFSLQLRYLLFWFFVPGLFLNFDKVRLTPFFASRPWLRTVPPNTDVFLQRL